MNQLYVKLATTNIKNSRQFYLPYLLTGMLSVAMYYMMLAIQYNEGIQQMPGADSLKTILSLGSNVIGIFVFIFLFYTNSFIIKRRKKELGIYNILGMEKKHIAKELAVETLFSAAVSVGGGLIFGVVFHKFMMMLLYRLSGIISPIQFSVSFKAIGQTAELFGIIYAATLVYDMMQVKLANPVELLHGGNVGEKEPKTKILMTLAGTACLGAGYYISITTKSPLQALTLFFVAVMLVIIGTYCLFTAGSIAILKLLRNNKKYYYQTKHFTAVSGMIYRMKQNAVGLANICILSTMVLVMISTTVCMYVGIDDELENRYPGEISISGKCSIDSDTTKLVENVKDVIKESGRTVTYERAYTSLIMPCVNREGEFFFTPEEVDKAFGSDIVMLYFMTKDEYEELEQTEAGELKQDEILVIGNPVYSSGQMKFFDTSYTVKEYHEFSDENDKSMATVFGGVYYIIMSDEQALEQIYRAQEEALGVDAAMYEYSLYLDIDGTREEKLACDRAVNARIEEIKSDPELTGCISLYAEYREQNRADFNITYGGFFFLGLFLGIMFLMVTVLIIFYKQISEGYDDRERFAIMEKVGMSNREVKATISAQVRLVFLLPVVTAAIHVAAAFPMIKRLLLIMNLTNGNLFALCLVGTVLVFGIIYVLVFLLTSRSYYKIVGNQV